MAVTNSPKTRKTQPIEENVDAADKHKTQPFKEEIKEEKHPKPRPPEEPNPELDPSNTKPRRSLKVGVAKRPSSFSHGVVSEKAMKSLQVQRRHKLYNEFGYKECYGLTTSEAKAEEKRSKAVKDADDWFFAELGRRSVAAQDLMDVRAFFFACRKDFGWKSSYGALANIEKGDQKRKDANKKALKYVCEKYGCNPSEIESWCF